MKLVALDIITKFKEKYKLFVLKKCNTRTKFAKNIETVNTDQTALCGRNKLFSKKQTSSPS